MMQSGQQPRCLFEDGLAFDFDRSRLDALSVDYSNSGFSGISTPVSEMSDVSTTEFRGTLKRRRSTPEVPQKPRRSLLKNKKKVPVEHHVKTGGVCESRECPPLAKTFPTRLGAIELVILRQPEGHHRARYQKEGSRGCIKDTTGNTCPALQIRGYAGPGVIQAFIATENGKVRPHTLYRACRVGGKHCTQSKEYVVGSTNVLEMDLLPHNNGTINVDCLGILKLRNVDLDQVSDSESRRRKQAPSVRVVFRAILRSENGTKILQTVSTPICCTPSPGMPEIQRISHPECPVTGGEMIVVGRNFVKDESKLYVVEYEDESQQQVSWEAQVPLAREYFHAVHLVATLPPYKDVNVSKEITIYLIVKNKNKTSEPYELKYVPRPERKETAGISLPASTSSPGTAMTNINNGASHLSAPDLHGVQGYQYCIQPPGSSQPIIITIPQITPWQSGHPSIEGVKVPAPTQIASAYAGQDLVPRPVVESRTTGELMKLDEPKVPARLGLLDCMMQPTEEELFDQILRDILDNPERLQGIASSHL